METFFLGLGILLLCIIINILFDISNDIIEGLLSIIKFVGYTFVCVGAYQYYTDIKHYVNEEKNTIAISNLPADTIYYDKIEKKIENGNFIWYKYEVKNKKGALDNQKHVIIPAVYDVIYYISEEKMFFVKNNKGSMGCYYANGKIFIGTSRGYNGYIKRIEISDNRYYYEVVKDDKVGIVDKSGKEIIKPMFKTIDYNNESTTDADIDSFEFLDDNDNLWLLYIYIDSNGGIHKLKEPEWDKIYGNENNALIRVRKYPNILYIGRKRYKSIGYKNGKKTYFRLNKYDDYEEEKEYIYIENNQLVSEEGNYTRRYSFIKDFSIYDYIHKKEHLQHQAPSQTQSSSPTYTPEYGQRDVWVDCMNCMGSGKCPSCHGNGRCVSTWSDGSYNDTYKCPVCHGGGRCQMCYGTKGHYEKQIYQIK